MTNFKFNEKHKENVFEFKQTGFAISRKVFTVQVEDEKGKLHLTIKSKKGILCEFVEDREGRWSIPKDTRDRIQQLYTTSSHNDIVDVMKALYEYSLQDELLNKYKVRLQRLNTNCKHQWADFIFGKPTV